MKRRKSWLMITGVLLAIGFIAVASIAITTNSIEAELAEQLELGQKYLDEMKYEQAIVAYEAAIEIDSKCEDAYLALAEIYVEAGAYETAIDVLTKGAEETDSEKILVYLSEIETIYSLSNDGEGVQGDALEDELREYDTNGNLVKLTRYDAAGSVWQVVIYEYDNDGKVIRTTWYRGDGSIDCVDEYTSDERLMKTTWYDVDGSIRGVTEW